MKLVKQEFEIIKPEMVQFGAACTSVLKHVEKCARVAYKSEDKITEDSWQKFTQMLQDKGHLSVFEHGTVYLTLNDIFRWAGQENDNRKYIEMFKENPYSRVVEAYLPFNGRGFGSDVYRKFFFITTNYRVLIENKCTSLIGFMGSNGDNGPFHHRVTVRFICSRAIANELVRHRKFSFTQESTRWINYKGKDMEFVIPTEFYNDLQEGIYALSDDCNAPIVWANSMALAEKTYKALVNTDVKPQVARGVLPLDLKTEVVMTGFISDWWEFFKLRTAENAHPDMRALIVPLKQAFFDNNLLNNPEEY